MKVSWITLYTLSILSAASNVVFAIAGAGTWQGHASCAAIATMYFLREWWVVWRQP